MCIFLCNLTFSFIFIFDFHRVDELLGTEEWGVQGFFDGVNFLQVNEVK
jgi:hypothetical protein